MTDVTLSLISHTNVGKTTLARTLLRRDVGEVLDQAHVTEESEVHELIEADGATLRVWDTPGFGNTVRLMRRLRRENDPLGWFLHRVWDRVVDRPLYCSQQAALNVRREADVVLYLVNASEEPEHAGYIGPELELLTWMRRPVLLLLNQVGPDADVEEHWRGFAHGWPIVRDVLSLDAFTRCWVHEEVMLHRVVDLLQGPKREAMAQLARAWRLRNLEVFRTSVRAIGRYLASAATDRENAGPPGDTEERGVTAVVGDVLKLAGRDKKRAMKALDRRLDLATEKLMRRLIEAHGLRGDSSSRIEKSLQDFQVRGATPINERTGAVAGAVVSGMLSGLAADVLSGGLTLGGGVIAGGILGALGGSVLARGYRIVFGGQEPSVTWSVAFLNQLVRQVSLRYLAVAHFGRGRGDYRDIEQPSHWSDAVDAALKSRERELQRVWKRAVAEPGDETRSRLADDLGGTVEQVLLQVLREAYPEADLPQ